MDKTLFKKVRKVILVGAYPVNTKVCLPCTISVQGRQAGRTVMKNMLSICVALLIILMSSILAHCQGDSLVDDMKTIDGDVVSVDIQKSCLAVKSSEVMTFFVSPDAKIVNADGFDMQLSDVSAGNYVTVDYRDDKSGKHIMSGMEIAYNR